MSLYDELVKEAQELQERNLWMRKFYLCFMLVFFVLGIATWFLAGNVLPWVFIPFFGVLVVINERLIRKMREGIRKAGIS